MKAYSYSRPLLDAWTTLSGNTLVEGGCGCIVDTFPLKKPLELWKLSCGHCLEGSCLKEAVGISMWTSLRSEPFWRGFGICLVDNFGGISFLLDIRWGFVGYWWTLIIKEVSFWKGLWRPSSYIDRIYYHYPPCSVASFLLLNSCNMLPIDPL